MDVTPKRKNDSVSGPSVPAPNLLVTTYRHLGDKRRSPGQREQSADDRFHHGGGQRLLFGKATP
jgi:hypothetical protein